MSEQVQQMLHPLGDTQCRRTACTSGPRLGFGGEGVRSLLGDGDCASIARLTAMQKSS